MTNGTRTLSSEQYARKKALWQARNKAYRRLAVAHPQQFEQFKQEALADDGQAAIGHYTQEGK